MKIRYPVDGDSVRITLSFTEAIGLYKMALAINHPTDDWTKDEDVEPLSAALQAHLSGIVGP